MGTIDTIQRQSSLSQSSAPRGPPRKPKQSGHALWVGNLPPATNVIELKDYFSREATNEIESVFLISKSNCAFVNYRTEETCAAAMARFHDTRFKGVRLVCRLRRTTKTAVGTADPIQASVEPPTTDLVPSQDEGTETKQDLARDTDETRKESDGETKDRFFILKSLTMEDLESSVRNGIWATQKHNEVVLNEAYTVSTNVELLEPKPIFNRWLIVCSGWKQRLPDLFGQQIW